MNDASQQPPCQPLGATCRPLVENSPFGYPWMRCCSALLRNAASQHPRSHLFSAMPMTWFDEIDPIDRGLEDRADKGLCGIMAFGRCPVAGRWRSMAHRPASRLRRQPARGSALVLPAQIAECWIDYNIDYNDVGVVIEIDHRRTEPKR